MKHKKTEMIWLNFNVKMSNIEISSTFKLKNIISLSNKNWCKDDIALFDNYL